MLFIQSFMWRKNLEPLKKLQKSEVWREGKGDEGWSGERVDASASQRKEKFTFPSSSWTSQCLRGHSLPSLMFPFGPFFSQLNGIFSLTRHLLTFPFISILPLRNSTCPAAVYFHRCSWKMESNIDVTLSHSPVSLPNDEAKQRAKGRKRRHRCSWQRWNINKNQIGLHHDGAQAKANEMNLNLCFMLLMLKWFLFSDSLWRTRFSALHFRKRLRSLSHPLAHRARKNMESKSFSLPNPTPTDFLCVYEFFRFSVLPHKESVSWVFPNRQDVLTSDSAVFGE